MKQKRIALLLWRQGEPWRANALCVSVLERQALLGTMPPPSDIVKVAIEWPGAHAQLLEIDQVSSGSEGSGSAG